MTNKKIRLKIKKLSIKRESRVIINNLELEALSGDKIVIVGENGIGKSTLLKAIKEKHLFEDKINFNGTVSYLPQVFSEFSERSVLEYLIIQSQNSNLIKLYSKKDNGEISEDEFTKSINFYGWFEMTRYVSQLDCQRVLDQKFELLSGGQKTKINLALLRYQNSDLLLLDEPTNNLDEQGKEWLKKFLDGYKGIVILVTHDRKLINEVANNIYEIDPETKKMVHFRGNYQNYLKEKEKHYQRAKQLRGIQEKEVKELKKKIEKVHLHNETYKPKPKNEDKMAFHHRGQRYKKSQKRIANQLQNKKFFIEDNFVAVPSMSRRKFEIDFLQERKNSDIKIKIDKVSKKINQDYLFKDLSFEINSGEKFLIKGKNGVGKTTLLRIILGLITKDEGDVGFSPNELKIGFLDQEQEGFNLEQNMIQFLITKLEWKLSEEEVKSRLTNSGIFHPQELFLKISELSVGCQRKIQLIAVIWGNPDILILDEPTNHIDLYSLEKIENWLKNFSGPVLAVSHDQYFAEKICNKIIDFNKFVV
ncbi:MAG: Nucleotide-binding protein ExpZ [Mycoplasmataceae bacterium]|nr:MAG: Nucleotide-binding protein ExpZ [Mycoplasmataceae bacterium]